MVLLSERNKTMPMKVFDFECDDCKEEIKNQMIDMEKEDPPVCPKCGKPMRIRVGTVWAKHLSWSKWNI